MPPFSDSQAVDDSMPKTDQPPDLDLATETSEGFTIPSDLASTAGIADLQPGDKFTVTITGTVSANDPATGISATLTDASNGQKNDVLDMEDTGDDGGKDGFEKPKSKIELGPKDAQGWMK